MRQNWQQKPDTTLEDDMTEQPKPIDLTTMTVEALKALAYDQLRILQQTQVNINTIEAEINKRAVSDNSVSG